MQVKLSDLDANISPSDLSKFKVIAELVISVIFAYALHKILHKKMFPNLIALLMRDDFVSVHKQSQSTVANDRDLQS